MYDILDYFEATTVVDALNYLNENSSAKIIAGGTDVLIKSREGKDGYTNIKLVGVTRIPQLKEISQNENGDIFIGAACTFTEIEQNSIVKNNIGILATAAGTVGGPQIRNVGTMGGNICNGVTSADTASTLFVLNAKLILQSETNKREIAIADFYLGVGKVDLVQGEMLIGFKINKCDFEGYSGHYIKFAQRNAMDIATIGCAALVKSSDNKIDDLRLAFGVAGPVPMRMTTAEHMAQGCTINEANLQKIGNAAVEQSKARDSWRASKEFREQLILALTARAIKTVVEGKENA